MIRVSITPEAFEAIVATLSLGSVGYEPKLNSKGERRIWIEDRPSLTCLVVTKASPWGHTCGDFATRLAFGLVGDFASRWNGGRSSGGLIGSCRHLVGISTRCCGGVSNVAQAVETFQNGERIAQLEQALANKNG